MQVISIDFIDFYKKKKEIKSNVLIMKKKERVDRPFFFIIETTE